MIYMIDPTLLTSYSYNKYKLLPNGIYQINDKLRRLLQKMYRAFAEPIQLENVNPTQISSIRNIFIDFNNHFLAPGSKFENDIEKMNYNFSCRLIAPKGLITMNFILKKKDFDFIALIIHATHTFCNYFNNFNYNGLIINVCLDSNHRIISSPNHLSVADQFIFLKDNSLAFNVSGVTYKHKKIINLTRKEEIIKLLFHEMIHYVELDDELTGIQYKKEWSVKGSLNVSEAYTEFLAVIFNAAYQAIQIGTKLGLDSMSIFSHIIQKEIDHSIFLTANILKFYGYNQNTYTLFFEKGKPHVAPITLWEYIFLRTMLLLNLNNTINTIPNNYQITDPQIVIDLLNNDNDLINNLMQYMSKPFNRNVSYNAVDIDWLKFI